MRVKGSWGGGAAEEHIAWVPVVSGLREYAEASALRVRCSVVIPGLCLSTLLHCHIMQLFQNVCRLQIPMSCGRQALEAGGKPAPKVVRRLLSGQHVVDVFPTGYAPYMLVCIGMHRSHCAHRTHRPHHATAIPLPGMRGCCCSIAALCCLTPGSLMTGWRRCCSVAGRAKSGCSLERSRCRYGFDNLQSSHCQQPSLIAPCFLAT